MSYVNWHLINYFLSSFPLQLLRAAWVNEILLFQTLLPSKELGMIHKPAHAPILFWGVSITIIITANAILPLLRGCTSQKLPACIPQAVRGTRPELPSQSPPTGPGHEWCEDEDGCQPTQSTERSGCFLFPTSVPHCIWPRSFGCGQRGILGIILFFSLNLLPYRWFISPGLKLDSSWASLAWKAFQRSEGLLVDRLHRMLGAPYFPCLPSPHVSPPLLLCPSPTSTLCFYIYHGKKKRICDSPWVQASSLF